MVIFTDNDHARFADFLLLDHGIAMEVDGKTHKTDLAKQKDTFRDHQLKQLGIHTARFESFFPGRKGQKFRIKSHNIDPANPILKHNLFSSTFRAAFDDDNKKVSEISKKKKQHNQRKRSTKTWREQQKKTTNVAKVQATKPAKPKYTKDAQEVWNKIQAQRALQRPIINRGDQASRERREQIERMRERAKAQN